MSFGVQRKPEYCLEIHIEMTSSPLLELIVELLRLENSVSFPLSPRMRVCCFRPVAAVSVSFCSVVDRT